ncbi:unnamed protein product [Prunus brigantina]
MDEAEFRRLLDLFPIVRSRDYHAGELSSVLYFLESCSFQLERPDERLWKLESYDCRLTDEPSLPVFSSCHMIWKVKEPWKAELEQSKESTSKSAQHEEVKEWQDAWDEGDKKEVEKQGLDQHGAFWEKLKLVAERKVGEAEAERFCKAFQQVHKKLVYEELSLDAAQKFLNSS